MPAPAVTPAPIVYSNVVVVKTLVFNPYFRLCLADLGVISPYLDGVIKLSLIGIATLCQYG